MDAFILNHLRIIFPEEIVCIINDYYLSQTMREVVGKLKEMIDREIWYDLSYGHAHLPNVIISTPTRTRQILQCICGEPLFYGTTDGVKYLTHVPKKYCHFMHYGKRPLWESERMIKIPI